jgi:hypothetical protein
MTDHAPDATNRRRFLRHTAAGMIGWASVECSAVAPPDGGPIWAWSAPPRAEDEPNTHNMLVAGQESVFLSHLPMFQRLDKAKTEFTSPHRFQVITEASFASGGKPVTELYLKDRRAHPEVRLYTLGPQEEFVLTRLFPASASEPRVTSFTATVFRGHLEAGAKAVPGLEKITVTVNRVVHARKFDPRGTKPAQLEYLLFGTPGDLLLAHAIFQPPDFDHVVGITLKGTTLTAKDLAGDLRVVFPDRKNVAAERARESQTLKAVLRRGSESGKDTPIDVQVTRQFYFEEGELLIPHTFDTTAEEKKGV